MTIAYLLAESVVTVTATKVYVKDTFDGGIEKLDASATSASIVLDVRGDETGLCELATGGRGQRDVTVGLSTDRRLSSVSYKSVGSGARVLAATAKLLATVVGLGLRVSAPGPTGGFETTGDEPKPPDPEEEAKLAWEAEYAELAHRRAACVQIISGASSAELTQWQAALASPDRPGASLARARQMGGLADRARSEVERIDQHYAAWRSGTRTTRQEAWTYSLSMAQLPDRPGMPVFADQAQVVWDAVGVGVQIVRLDAPRRPHPRAHHESGVAWRVPRPVRLNVWRRGSGPDSPAALTSSTVTSIVDQTCDIVNMPLASRTFGTDGLELTFGELGVPTSIGTGRTSSAAAVAEAVAEVPTHALTGLETASKLQSSIAGLRDAGAERQLQGLKRRLERLQQELQLKAETATAHDVVRLKRLEQQVAIAEATGKLAPATELDELTYEYNLLKMRKDLEALMAD